MLNGSVSFSENRLLKFTNCVNSFNLSTFRFNLSAFCSTHTKLLSGQLSTVANSESQSRIINKLPTRYIFTLPRFVYVIYTLCSAHSCRIVKYISDVMTDGMMSFPSIRNVEFFYAPHRGLRHEKHCRYKITS